MFGAPKPPEDSDDSSDCDCEHMTVIGRMHDLVQFDKDPDIDTWRKSGIKPPPGQQVTWFQNRDWLDERIARGDCFGIATDPRTLPPITGPNSYIRNQPNGWFTAKELDYLKRMRKTVHPMW